MLARVRVVALSLPLGLLPVSLAVAAPPAAREAAATEAKVATPEKLAIVLPKKQLKLFALVYRSDSNTVGEVRLNDMPMCSFSGKGNSGSSGEVQGWLVPGTNRLDISIDKVPADGDEEMARVSLHGLDAPGFPEDENRLWLVSLKRVGTKPGLRSYTFELPVDQAPPGELWKKAAVFTALSDADKKDIDTLTRAVLATMQKGSAADLKKIFAWRFAERARTTYSDPKELEGMVDQMLPEMKKTFGKAKVSAPLAYQLVGGGRVVVVTGKDGKAPIAVKQKDGEASMPIRVAKIDGAWTLVQ